MKSQVKDLLEMTNILYNDVFVKCVTEPDLRDLMTIKSRIKNEGVSFLTLTLPNFCKDIELSLSKGYIEPSLFRSFRKNGLIPAFLQGIVSQIFDRETGRIQNENLLNVSCIEGVRGFTAAFKKLETPCATQKVNRAIENFRTTEYELSTFRLPDEEKSEFLDVSSCLWNDLINIDINDLIPKHGPGATAERISGNAKYSWRRWHNRLEPYFPFIETAYTIGSYGSKEFDDVTIVDLDNEQPVRIITVPKTMKGPRIIAIEPACMQYTQQAVRSALYRHIEHAPLTSGHVNFHDQSINRELAMKSSVDSTLATLDLTDASDRVMHDLAICMFDNNPELKGCIEACRSISAKLPNGDIISPLKKFASMGSALCFPVEAMYFYTICIVALLKKHSLSVTTRNIKMVSRGVYIYGDDIIVPIDEVTAVSDCLQKYNCKVNLNKSFWTGKFRESCGMDAYNGIDVTPTYIRKLRPRNRRQAGDLVSWIKTANLLMKKGYAGLSSYMFSMCERVLGKLPIISEDSPILGRIGPYRDDVLQHRWNKSLQRLEVKAWVTEPVYRADILDGYGALIKCLLNPVEFNVFDITSHDNKHLQRSARHGAVTLKSRWTSI